MCQFFHLFCCVIMHSDESSWYIVTYRGCCCVGEGSLSVSWSDQWRLGGASIAHMSIYYYRV
jgi:hypothetical protein